MALDEIEIPGTSIGLRCLNFQTEDIRRLFNKIGQEGEFFNLETETSGFHDLDANDKLIRGFFSIIVPFEVEHLTDGFVTKTLFKKVETCEFFMLADSLFVTGKTAPQKIFERVVSTLAECDASGIEFEFNHLSQFQERVSMLKAIVVTNPKTKEIRRARLAGKIENYIDYNVIDPRNHGIESVSGLVDSPLGPMTVTASKKGVLRLGVRRGFILSLDCLQWLLKIIMEENFSSPLMKID